MKKMFFVMLAASLAGVQYANASPGTFVPSSVFTIEKKTTIINTAALLHGLEMKKFESIPTGLLRKDVKRVTKDEAKDLLDAFVRYSDEIEEGDDESDIDFIKRYIRDDIPGYDLDAIRMLLLDRIALALGKDPSTETMTDEEAYDVIENLTAKRIDQSYWKTSGYRSLSIKMDGTGGLSHWIPNRKSEELLFLGDEPLFALECMNPTIIPEAEIPVTDVVTQKRRRGEGTTPTPPAPKQTGGNNSSSVATNTNNITLHVTIPEQESAPQPVTYERKGNGFLHFLAGAAVGVGGTLLLNNNGRNRNFGNYRQNDNRNLSNDRYSVKRRSSGGRRNHGGGNYGGGNSGGNDRRYNTSSLSSRKPTNYGGSNNGRTTTKKYRNGQLSGG